MKAASIQTPPRPWYLRGPGLLLLIVFALCWRASGGSLSAFFTDKTVSSVGAFASGLWPPATSASFLSFIVRPFFETISIAVLGLSLALVIAIPLSVGAAAPSLLLTRGDRVSKTRWAVFWLCRSVLNVMRCIPELIWALLFVRALGIGPLPGVLALGVGYAGILGKVFSEIFESAPKAPVQALSTSGASPFRTFVFGVVPTAAPLLASYTLYRFDCALRASAVLGVVGAGGLGQQVDLSLKMFAYDELATLVIVLFCLVAAVDHVSARIRRHLAEETTFLPQGRRGLYKRLFAVAAWIGVLVGCSVFLDLTPSDLVSSQSFESMKTFVAGMFPPSTEHLASLLPRMGETLAVSIVGTVLAAAGGFLLALGMAVYRLESAMPGERPGSKAQRAWLRSVALFCNAMMNLGRTLPELLFALAFIFIIGLGPFAGALALAVHTGGVLGRLYAEALEEVPTATYRALRQSGSSRISALLFGHLPQAFPTVVAYTLYRWEVNIRASAVLGVVGAGGLGRELYLSLSLFDHHRTLTLVICIFLLVTLVDWVSGVIRRQVAVGAAAKGALDSPTGPLEVSLLGHRLLVVRMNVLRAVLFTRRRDVPLTDDLVAPIAFDIGEEEPVSCEAVLLNKREEPEGVYYEVRLHAYGLRSLFRLYRFLGGRRWSERSGSTAAVEAY